MKEQTQNLAEKYKYELGEAFGEKGQARLHKKLLSVLPLLETGKFEKAIAILLKLKEKCSQLQDTRGVYLLLGRAYEGCQMRGKAKDLYRELIERDDSYSMAWTALGRVYQKEGKLDEAIEHLQKAIMLSANNAVAYTTLSFVLYAQRKLDEAVPTALHALSLDEHQHVAAGVICLSYALLGNKELSQKFFEIAVKAGADEQGLRTTMKSHLRRPSGLNGKYFS